MAYPQRTQNLLVDIQTFKDVTFPDGYDVITLSETGRYCLLVANKVKVDEGTQTGEDEGTQTGENVCESVISAQGMYL